MTPTQQKIYTYILEYKEKYGVVPSTVVTARKFKTSQQTVHDHYTALVKIGKLKKIKKVVATPHFEVVHTHDIVSE
jgi:hypothetical protein